MAEFKAEPTLYGQWDGVLPSPFNKLTRAKDTMFVICNGKSRTRITELEQKGINTSIQVCTAIYRSYFYLYLCTLNQSQVPTVLHCYRNKDISGAGMKGRMSSPNN